MKDGDLFAESPDFVGLRSVYRGCVAYGTIHPSCGLGFPTAQIHVSRNRNSTSQRIAKWAVFMGLCECSEVIHSHLASCHSQIFSDLTGDHRPGIGRRHFQVRGKLNFRIPVYRSKRREGYFGRGFGARAAIPRFRGEVGQRPDVC